MLRFPQQLQQENDFLKSLLFSQTRQLQKLARHVHRQKCLVQVYAALNVGDDLFLQILVNRYPNVIFFLPVAQPYDEIFKGNPNVICEVNRVKKQKFLDDFDGYDFAISIGGSLYQSHIIKGSFNRDVDLYKRFVAAGKPLFIIGSNFDRNYATAPYNENSFHELFASGGDLLKVCLRDVHSYNFFRDLPNVTCAPDIIFALNDNFSPTENRRAGLGISVISPLFSVRPKILQRLCDRYTNGVVSLVKSAVKRNVDVKIFSFCLREEDHKFVEIVAKNLTPEERAHVQHVAYDGNLVQFLKTFASMKYIVATRFHANVLALKFRQRLFPIVYNDKTLNLLEDLQVFDRDEFYDLRDGTELDSEKVWRLLEKPKDITKKMEQWSALATLHFREIDRYLSNFNQH